MGSGHGYVGRFAPSPTGALHAGSLVAALASWLDARAHRAGAGRWLVRIEDLDRARCAPGADQVILRQLHDCALAPDAPPTWQSQHLGRYRKALDRLVHVRRAYPCGCSRKDIEAELTRLGRARLRGAELVYPGTCRDTLHGTSAPAWRFRTQPLPGVDPARSPASVARCAETADPQLVQWCDRRLGAQQEHVGQAVGDFVLKRADGAFSYQLAVVVDDAAQGVSHVVRGADLADNTARQILLQRALALPQPRYLHTPLVLAANGEKLSKQNGAQAVDTSAPLRALNAAATTLGLRAQPGSVGDALAAWVEQWRDLYNPAL